MSVEEINRTLRAALTYDDYRYQKANGIRITEPLRAEGLHKILYQCPHCTVQSKMASKGSELFCRSCGKRWQLGEDGSFSALDGKTEFSHIPDWFEWEREQVKCEIENGSYRYEDEVDVFSLPRCYRFEPLGSAKILHDVNEGFVLEGFCRGKPYRIQRKPLQINSLHVEYDFPHVKPFDCFDLSTESDSFYCYPAQENVLTKLAFATGIIHQKALAESHSRTRKVR